MAEGRRDRFAGLTLVLVALLVAASLWKPGMANTRGGGDSPFLLVRLDQMVTNLRGGVFPVRWMPDAAYGLGYPFYSYYAALPYYLAGLLVLVGLDVLTALKLVQTLGFVWAALAMYGWMHGLSRSRWAAWLAAAAYTTAPFHLVNVYVRGDSLSELYAFVFYPSILWALDRLCATNAGRRGARFVAAALAYAGLALSHNLSFAIFSPFILLYLAALAWRKRGRRWQVLGLGLGALGFGFLLAAWDALPAVMELDFVQLGPSTQDYFHYSRHFRALNLVQWRLLFDYSIQEGQMGRSPFAMGLAQATFAVLGALVLALQIVRRHLLKTGGQERLDARWWVVPLGLVGSTLMITPLSRFLWDHLPLLPLVQFPWRFLSVQALFAAAATAALVPSWRPSSGRGTARHPSWVALSIAAMLVASALLSLHPDRLLVGPADVTTERLQLYELFTQNIGTTIRYEWLPRTTNPRPFTSGALIAPDQPPRATPLEGASVEAALVKREPTRQVWQVWGEGGEIAFPLLYWPGWEGQVDGQAVDVWPVEGSGWLALQVPPGDGHTVSLKLKRTPARTLAEAISLTAAGIALGIITFFWHRTRTARLAGVRRSLVVLPVLGLLLVPNSAFGGDGDLTMDFVHMPYLHHDPEGVDFGVARLARYELSAEELAPGDTLTVASDWELVDDSAYTATVRLVSPAAVRREEIAPVCEESVPLSSHVEVGLAVPEDVSRGVYLLQMRLLGPQRELQARTPQGHARGTLYLRPVRLLAGPPAPSDLPVLAPFGSGIRLHTVTITQPSANWLGARMAWSATQPVAANYVLSLRLLDPAGQIRAAMDTQPGYGFLPTSLWRPGELVSDQCFLSLPDDLPPDGDYSLAVLLYQAATEEPVGQARVEGLALPLDAPFEAQPAPRSFALPELERPLAVDFGGEVRLSGYDLVQERTELHLTLWWQALQAPQDDYTVFAHLFDPATETIVAQSDAPPRGGAYPTSWWAAGEVVSETVALSLKEVQDGAYRLAIGLYDRTLTRLQIVDPEDRKPQDDRAVLPVEVRVGGEE